MSGLSIRTKNGQLNKIVIDTSSTNKLSGEINASVFEDLEEIIVNNSGISSLSGGVNLRKISLGGNSISNFSSIHPGISSFTNLTELILSADDHLTGNVPSLSDNVVLRNLTLHGNSLDGILPTLSDNPSLSYVDFRDNSFSGEIPALSSNPELKEIYFNGNPELSGFLPELSACQKLRNINFIKLGLSGRFHDFEKTPNLETYHAFQNHMTGGVPALSACTNAITMDLNQNYLSGGIPFINNLTNLRLLNLQNNGLSGHFPDITNLGSLEFLRFNKNDRNGSDGIIGEIPDLSGCPNLKVLDIAVNQLTGWNGTVWPSVQFNNIQVQSNLLPQGEIDRILAAINATGLSKPVGASGYLINLAGTGNAAPTNGASNADVVDLKAKGWSVEIN